MKRWLAVLAFLGFLARTSVASADPTDRSVPWQTVTSITTVAAMGTVALMPRLFYADPETTAGWKARWHVSVLAPTMTLTALTLLNEYALKDALAVHRPGCDEASQGTGHCLDYGSLSSHSFAAFAGFGQGTATFLVDTLKWSDGRLNGGALAGEVILPLVFAAVTSIGRSAGNWEQTGSIVLSSGVGLGFGLVTGLVYSWMARPECGYDVALICW